MGNDSGGEFYSYKGEVEDDADYEGAACVGDVYFVVVTMVMAVIVAIHIFFVLAYVSTGAGAGAAATGEVVVAAGAGLVVTPNIRRNDWSKVRYL